MRLAVFQNGDEPELASTAVLLRAAGYDVKYCGPTLRKALTDAGCDTVLSVEHMYALGYDRLDPTIGPASLEDMERCDLFLEIKVRNIPKIIARWPRLAKRIAWKRVNGSCPEICPKGGDEVNLPCPVITACLWYGTDRYRHGKAIQPQSSDEHLASRAVTLQDHLAAAADIQLHDTESMAYVFWPPYPRSGEYDRIDRSGLSRFDPPFGVCHNVYAWGYRDLVDRCVQSYGCRFHGNGSPAGQVPHSAVPGIAARALAMVHLKSVDCPGWALYEALLAGCPVVTGRLLNSRMLAYGLLEDGVTCYEFGVPATLEYGRGDPDLEKCFTDIGAALEKLRDPAENRRVGEAGRKRLNDLMWSERRDGDSFRAFLARHFGG